MTALPLEPWLPLIRDPGTICMLVPVLNYQCFDPQITTSETVLSWISPEWKPIVLTLTHCFCSELQIAQHILSPFPFSPLCPTLQKACLLTWMWPWEFVLMCCLWCGCCIRRKGLRTQSDWRGCLLLLHSLFLQCRPLTTAGTTFHLDHACSPRCT